MGRNIIFCADGTWNHPDELVGKKSADTNVWKFYTSLLQTESQIAFYDDGIGVGGGLLNELLSGITGVGLFKKIKDGYRNIAKNYQDGDKIHLFGFSRGAYTARAIAGMIATCGIPANGQFSEQALEDAFIAYRERNKERKQQLVNELSKKYGNRAVTIAQVGVWDTVGELGIPSELFEHIDSRIYGFLDTTLHPDIEAAWHAVAIDEKRGQFKPTLWVRAADAPHSQQLDQVWFSGVHSDVGGGYPDPCLSDITLGWMIKKAASKGLSIDPDKFKKYTSLNTQAALVRMNASWRVIPWGLEQVRTIPPGSVIADSVITRIQNDAAYRPPNLMSHLSRAGNNMLLANIRTEQVLSQAKDMSRH